MNKPFIVAEISGNHLGDHKRALHLVEAAAIVGADAIKIQKIGRASCRERV